jgi:transcriptional repressor NrdR
MRCPFCGHEDSQVKDSRPTEDGAAIRRRRQCPSCGGRFTTFERVQLRELTLVKKSGKREVFDRDKLARSIEIACRKRPIEPERIERLVNPVAYIRFASVYKDFREARDFETFVTGLPGAPEPS